jgi:hypothetical protein
MTEQTEPIEGGAEEIADGGYEESYEDTGSLDAEDSSAVDDGTEYVEVSNSDEYWDAFDLSEYLTDSDEEAEETDDAEGEKPAFPSEDSDVDAEGYAETEELDDEEPEFTEEELLAVDLDRPAPLSRRKAERVVKGIIEPLRDPNTPIDDVLTAMAEFHPTRTQQLAEAIVAESVNSYPEEWLRSITGLDVSVEQIRQWAEQGGSTPSNTAPIPTQQDTTELNAAVSELDELYGASWRDPANDERLLDSDRTLARTVRSQMAQQDAYSALQQELEQTKSQLNEIKPQIDDIRTAQEREFEQSVIQTYQNTVADYRQKVETNAIPKVLAIKGLVPRESDSDEVRAVKEVIASRFQPFEGYGSDFDVFLEKQFSGREAMTKAIQRVGANLAEATRLEAQSKFAPPADAHVLQLKANAIKEQAIMEQDALTVWTRKAAAEFLDSPMVQPMVQLLEQNADMARRLQGVGRREIVGQTTAIGAEGGLQARLQEAKSQGVNPFDVDISELLGGR